MTDDKQRSQQLEQKLTETKENLNATEVELAEQATEIGKLKESPARAKEISAMYAHRYRLKTRLKQDNEVPVPYTDKVTTEATTRFAFGSRCQESWTFHQRSRT